MPIRVFENKEVYEYTDTMKSILATTRFNDKTWSENQEFVQQAIRRGELSNRTQCLYPCSIPIGSNIPVFANVFVLEMNNETNQILGIGLLKNESPEYNKYPVYETVKYNQFSYQGLYHIHRHDMTEEEMVFLRDLEKMCFKGRRHQKRLQGIKAFPYDILYNYLTETQHDLVVEIAGMFKRRFLP
jgi:hypothetical protein